LERFATFVAGWQRSEVRDRLHCWKGLSSSMAEVVRAENDAVGGNLADVTVLLPRDRGYRQ